MGFNKVKLTVKVNQKIDLEFDLVDIIDEINQQPIAVRFNYVAMLLNSIRTTPEGEEKPLTKDHREVVQRWLQKHVKLLEGDE